MSLDDSSSWASTRSFLAPTVARRPSAGDDARVTTPIMTQMVRRATLESARKSPVNMFSRKATTVYQLIPLSKSRGATVTLKTCPASAMTLLFSASSWKGTLFDLNEMERIPLLLSVILKLPSAFFLLISSQINAVVTPTTLALLADTRTTFPQSFVRAISEDASEEAIIKPFRSMMKTMPSL